MLLVFNGLNAEVFVKIDDIILVGVMLVLRSMGLVVRESVSVQVLGLVEVKVS